MTFAATAHAYAAAVIAGEIVACKHVRNACKRHVRDMERAAGDWPYRFDEAKAERACKFMSRLPHTKGKWSRVDRLDPRANRLKLEPWQVFIICSLFGWVNKETGLRRFRSASIYVPRKNGKSLFAAGIGWYMFAYDNEPGAEVYCGATSEKQAYEVFKPARQMALKVPQLAEARGVTVNVSSLVIEGDGSKFEPVIGKPGDGSSPHCAIVDEFHEHPTGDLVDTMRTGMGAREQPLLLQVSTAGDKIEGPCRDDWNECEKLLDGVFEDETHFAIIFTIDDGDDWASEIALRKANPNFDISVSAKFLREELEGAKRDPKKQSAFKTKHLNMWVSARNAFFNVEQWHSIRDESLKIENMKGRRGVMAGDFALKHDIFARMMAFEVDDKIALFGRYYLPSDTVQLPQKQHYRKWAAEGRIIVHEGAIVNFREIEDDIFDDYSNFGLEEFIYDPAKAQLVANDLAARGVNCIDAYSGNGAKLPEWLMHFDGAYRAGKIVHDGDPVLTWAISNCVAKPAKRGMNFLTKDGNEKKIDPAIAALMAYGRLNSCPAPVQPFIA
mgnify:CR=1 FL=1